MSERRKILATLTRSRLLELARQFEVAGLSGQSKDQMVRAIARKRSIPMLELLEGLKRRELKAACRVVGLEDGGREKAQIIARLLSGKHSRPNAASGRKGTPKQARKREPGAAQSAGEGTIGSRAMAKKSSKGKREIEQYDHKDKTRANNPPVGLVTPATDPELPKKTYQYDPHCGGLRTK